MYVLNLPHLIAGTQVFAEQRGISGIVKMWERDKGSFLEVQEICRG